MIFSYSEMVKNKVKKVNVCYNTLYDNGKIIIFQKIKEFANTINELFIERLFLFNNNDIEIIFYSNDSYFSMKNCNGIIIYTKTKDKIYLLLICINNKYRNIGYGSIFLQEFIDYIRNKYKNKKIILHSIEQTIGFYKKAGFIEILEKPIKYKKLFKYEKYDKNIKLLELY